MSEPTYRIVTHHNPAKPPVVAWCADVVQLSDDALVEVLWGPSEPLVIAMAREWIGGEATRGEGTTLYATETGELVPAPSTRSRMVHDPRDDDDEIDRVRSQSPSTTGDTIDQRLATIRANTARYSGAS